MKINSTIQFEFKSPENLQIFYQSFLPEFSDLPMKRSKWVIKDPEPATSTLVFSIESEDATAFRATINSLLQFAHIVEKSIEFVVRHQTA